ncbi:hypothetical protein M407DRAFT_32334 [Tulasnella calospora MUT 4182]|uniref:Uncharacterized protein n=1 Tax=Tulasnella calospora MUT 4182 TaxID=1051891 RepID=A0A0C3Q450_9AGAM|nr:hypothetical protein M407DRAFT_32334 [Tulasnella calospora MUT 4182]
MSIDSRTRFRYPHLPHDPTRATSVYSPSKGTPRPGATLRTGLKCISIPAAPVRSLLKERRIYLLERYGTFSSDIGQMGHEGGSRPFISKNLRTSARAFDRSPPNRVQRLINTFVPPS